MLSGFLRFRFELSTLGVRGFQWLDGSFVENIEAQESRAPSDIDVVTIIENSDPGLKRALIVRPDLVNHTIVKATFAVDSFLIPCDLTPVQLIDHTRCWIGLFSHRRSDRVWKGMLVTPLGPPSDDDAARRFLGVTP